MQKRFFILLFVFILGNGLYGQQLPVYSQYLYNRFLINPAVAGSDGYTSLNFTAREQWVGYSGAPRTYTFSWQTRILKKSYIIKSTKVRRKYYRPATDGKVGLGGYVFSDRNGLINRTGLQASYAYHLWLNGNTQASFGMSATAYHFRIDQDQIVFEDPSEPWLNNELRRGLIVPDANVGFHIMNPTYSVGFSAEQLFQSLGKFGDSAYDNFKMLRHYYLFGTYMVELNTQMELQPSVLVMMSDQVKPMADIGVTYIHDKQLWAGISYRTSGALITNIGMKYQNIHLGYAFDFTFGEIQRITYGTHEFTMALKFGDSARRYRWLDRY